VILVLSSFTCQMGVFAAERGDVKKLRSWFIVTFIMGAIFIGESIRTAQIAGGAGLIVAGGYLRPGRARRGDALVFAARRAATLVLGVALLLCIAGTIEGFISPQRLPVPVRAAIGLLTAVALLAYLLGSRPGRNPLAANEPATADRGS